MTLDLKSGTLSYKLNDEDCGIAFDGIDIEQKYVLAVSLFWGTDEYMKSLNNNFALRCGLEARVFCYTCE